MENGKHIWNFSSVGGVKRVNIESGDDLKALESLDQKLWTALSCPVHGLEIDAKTLELIDTNNDGRIRVPEILDAVKWITSVIKNPDDLLKQEKEFPLSAINDSTEEGKTLLASAQQILNNIGFGNATTITVEETSDTARIFAGTMFNGDGVITEDSTTDIEIKKLINEIMLCIGSIGDRSGKAGVSEKHINDFYENCELYSTWYSKAENDLHNILPFGDSTEDTVAIYNEVKSKIEDYFIRCRLAEFDPQSVEVLNMLVSRFEVISPKDLTTCMDEIATFPIAKIEAGKPLPLDKGINPAWELLLSKFVKLIIVPKFNQNISLKESEWKSLSDIFNSFHKWKSEKEGIAVEQLGLKRIREILSGKGKEKLKELVEKDNALKSEANSIILVDKLVRFYRDIFTLLNNFVTFYDFYSPNKNAIFQTGTLFIDQRSCDLCIKVNNMQKHSTMATLSGMFLIYCDCTSKIGKEKMTIVAAMTNGDIDNLIVGKNAIFYDRNGMDWDATVIKIIDNPISIRQAFWSPYRKVSKFIEAQINKMASERENEVQKTTTSNIEKTATTKIEESTKTQAPPFDIGKFVGIFAAIGLALGAIGGVLASFISGFFSLVWWKMPLALLGIILVISGPSMIIAWLKLRKRNLAPILDANGWAINARAIINIPFGNTLTHLAHLPKNSRLNLNDPFTNKKSPFLKIIIISVVFIGIIAYILWKYGYLQMWYFGY